jgi:DNA processing protein
VAIVGARAASDYGRAMARRRAGDRAGLGRVVVSGLARGIDAAAHRGALAAGGRTIAVIPSPLDDVTPRHHRDLAREIIARGAILTEKEGGAIHRGEFVKRNRLIAALAGATVVVEAAARSGALSTAAAARRLGRPVLAVPGDAHRETARGCHALIKGGARLCEHAGDVLAALGHAAPHPRAPGPAEPGPGAAPDATPEARMWAALDRDPRTVEALAARAGLDVARALAALLALQWAGGAAARPGQRWVRGDR